MPVAVAAAGILGAYQDEVAISRIALDNEYLWQAGPPPPVLDRTFRITVGEILYQVGYGWSGLSDANLGNVYQLGIASDGAGTIDPVPLNLYGIQITTGNVQVWPLDGGAYGALPRPGDLPASIQVSWGGRALLTLPVFTPGRATRISRYRANHSYGAAGVPAVGAQLDFRIVSPEAAIVAIDDPQDLPAGATAQRSFRVVTVGEGRVNDVSYQGWRQRAGGPGIFGSVYPTPTNLGGVTRARNHLGQTNIRWVPATLYSVPSGVRLWIQWPGISGWLDATGGSTVSQAAVQLLAPHDIFRVATNDAGAPLIAI